MARRERDRYTRRDRPFRREAGATGDDGSSDTSLGNPAVILGLAALIVVPLLLVIGFMYGRSGTAPDAAAGATPTAADAAGTTPTAGAETAPTPAAAASPATMTMIEPGDEVPALPEDAKARENLYTAPRDEQLDAEGKAYFATIETPHGAIVAELWPEVAPLHVNSFVFLARQGFFDGLTFHRVEPGFVIQGGDPQGSGMGGPGYNVPGEFNAANPVPHRAGTLAMARSGDPDSAGSQFYIVLEDGAGPSSLDGQYTNFGHVIGGMDAVRKVQVGDVMAKVTIEEKPISERVVSPDDIRQGKLPAGIE